MSSRGGHGLGQAGADLVWAGLDLRFKREGWFVAKIWAHLIFGLGLD